MIVKILGFIDFCAAIIMLSLIFVLPLPTQILLFFGGLLFVKGLFIFTGDLLSVVDITSAAVLLIGIFITPWTFLLWALGLLLMTKGAVSFF